LVVEGHTLSLPAKATKAASGRRLPPLHPTSTPDDDDRQKEDNVKVQDRAKPHLGSFPLLEPRALPPEDAKSQEHLSRHSGAAERRSQGRACLTSRERKKAVPSERLERTVPSERLERAVPSKKLERQAVDRCEAGVRAPGSTTGTERSEGQQEGEIGIVRPLGFGGVGLRGRGGVQRYHPHLLPSWLKYKLEPTEIKTLTTFVAYWPFRESCPQARPI
jgi:hypothetical protein